MDRLPTSIARFVGVSGGPHVERWWNALSADSRAELLQLWDARAEETFSARAHDRFEDLPIALYGVWVDPELARENAMWTQQLIEYVNAHPEVRFHMQERRFHICRSHPLAREVARTGVLPASFSCPVGRPACPFEGAVRRGEERSIHWVALPRPVVDVGR